MGSLLEGIQGLIRDLFRIRTLPRKRLLGRFMESTRLLLADVGATGNPKGVWREASEFSTFMRFDPDPRAAMSSGHFPWVIRAGCGPEDQLKHYIVRLIRKHRRFMNLMKASLKII